MNYLSKIREASTLEKADELKINSSTVRRNISKMKFLLLLNGEKWKWS
jgi:hypothetical protein